MTVGYYIFSGSLQANHINDVRTAVVSAYLSVGGLANTHIFLPQLDPGSLQLLINNLTINSQSPTIHPISNYSQIIATHSFDRLLVLVTGHGDKEGIDIGNAFIAPFPFMTHVRSVPGVKECIVVLGQCFAGVFNYLDIRQTAGLPKTTILGATALDSSLNWQVAGDWVNVYLNYFCEWLFNPIDIDGDGVLSLLDAHRFAGALVVSKLHELRFDRYIEMETQKETIKVLQVLSPASPRLAAVRSSIKANLEIVHTIQSPWVLNPDAARQMVWNPVQGPQILLAATQDPSDEDS